MKTPSFRFHLYIDIASFSEKKYPQNISHIQKFLNKVTVEPTAMAAMKVHGNPLSTATQRVLACFYEKDAEFQFVEVDMGAGEHKSEKFLSLNPFGQVPAFEEGDLKLFESRATTQYIAQEFSDKGTQLLLPGSNKTMAVLQLWKEVEAHQFDPPATKLVYELLYKPFFGMTTDTAVAEENEAKLAKVLDVYDGRLAQSKYLAGDQFTLADLHHLPTVQYLMGSSAKKLFDSRPHVSAWVADITARPSWTKVQDMVKQKV